MFCLLSVTKLTWHKTSFLVLNTGPCFVMSRVASNFLSCFRSSKYQNSYYMLPHGVIFMFCFVCVCFPDRVSLCNSLSCPGTLFVDQVTSNSQRSTYLCLPSTGTKGVYHHAQLSGFLFCLFLILIIGHSLVSQL